MPGGQGAQRALPAGVAEEVGDHHDQAAAARRAAQLLDHTGQVAPGALGGARGLGDAADQAAGVGEPAPCGHADQRVAGRHQGADPVAAAPGEVGDGGRGGDGQVALLAHGGAEVEARRQVDGQPRLQLAVGDGLADVRHGRAGGDRPVHPAHVVTGLVGAGLAGFRTRSGDQSQVVALEQPVEPAAHFEFEGAQGGLHAAAVHHRRRPVRARAGFSGAHGLPAIPACAGATGWPVGGCGRADTWGSGTVWSTRVMMWSSGTPSASAS